MKYNQLLDKFYEITANKDKALRCSLLMIDLLIKDAESEPFINSLSKLKLHEWKKLRSQLNSLLENPE